MSRSVPVTAPAPRPETAPSQRPWTEPRRGAGRLSRAIRSSTGRAASALLLALAAFLAGPGVAAREALGAETSSAALVEEANRKVRQHDVQGALALLGKAITADPANVDAHIRYQDLAKPSLGAGTLSASYGNTAKERPDDPVAQFLAARLLPPDQAADAFDKLSQRFKDSPWPRAGRARALEDLGRFADATTAHAEAVSRAGDKSVRFLAYRAYGYERGALWVPAADAWRAVLAANPKDLAAHLGLAEALRQGDRGDEALAALDDAAKVGATEPELAYRRGLVHADLRRWDKALESLDAALALDKGMVEALCAACEVSVREARAKAETEKRALAEKDFEKALGYGDRAVAAFAESAYARFVLAAAHEAAAETGKDALDPVHLETALKGYDAAIERLTVPDADRVRALTAKAYVQIERSDFAGAAETLQKAFDVDRTCLVAYGHAGFALAAEGKPQDAISKYYKPGLKVDPNCARLLHDMGVAYWEMKKPNDARKLLEDAARLDPRVGQYRLTLGEMYYELRRYKEAAVELAAATELLPRSATAWRSYARACYGDKRFDECAKGYEKHLELAPDAVDEWLYLGVVCAEELKDKERGRKAVLKFKEKGGTDPNLEDWMTQLLADTPDKP